MSFPTKLLWDETMPLLHLEGQGTRNFLHGQTTSNFLGNQSQNFIHTCWLNASGGVRALLEIRCLEQGAEVLVLGGNSKDLFDGFEKVIFPADQVRLKPLSQIRRLQDISKCTSEKFSGITWIDPDDSLPKSLKGYKLATKEQSSLWLLKQALPIGNRELTGDTNPFELGISDFVDLDKGCYLGQEMMAKLSRLGEVKQQLRILKSDGCLKEGLKLIKINSETNAQQIAGVITSTIDNSSQSGSIALALVRRFACSEKELFLEGTLSKVSIQTPKTFVGLKDVN